MYFVRKSRVKLSDDLLELRVGRGIFRKTPSGVRISSDPLERVRPWDLVVVLVSINADCNSIDEKMSSGTTEKPKNCEYATCIPYRVAR